MYSPAPICIWLTSRVGLLLVYYVQGRPSPLRPWCIFPPLFQISPYFRKKSDNLFLVIDHKFRLSPLFFPCFSKFHPLFRENCYFLPTFTNFPTVLEKFTCFLHTFSCILFPPLLWPWCIYASPNARTGRPWLRPGMAREKSGHPRWARSYGRLRTILHTLIILSCRHTLA